MKLEDESLEDLQREKDKIELQDFRFRERIRSLQTKTYWRKHLDAVLRLTFSQLSSMGLTKTSYEFFDFIDWIEKEIEKEDKEHEAALASVQKAGIP